MSNHKTKAALLIGASVLMVLLGGCSTANLEDTKAAAYYF